MTITKKNHWLRNMVIILILCATAGIALAVYLFYKDGGRTYAYTSIQFSFRGAADGKAPNGYPFDINGIYSDEVLDNAINESGLTGTYTTDQIRTNMVVTGVYPDNIAEHLTGYVSLLDTSVDNQAVMLDYHATQYSVILYNNFDKNISQQQLTDLLKNIMISYNNYFAKTYAVPIPPSLNIDTLNTYDYAQQLEIFSVDASQKMRFANLMQELAKDFQLNKKSFGDIAIRYENIDVDLNRLNANVILNSISKDQLRLRQRYEMEIRDRKMELESLKEELTLVESQLNSYDKDGIIYISANGELNQLGNSSSGTYDKMIEHRKKINDNIAELNATISMYQLRLDDMDRINGKAESDFDEETLDASSVQTMSEEEKEKLLTNIEPQILVLYNKMQALDDDFRAMLDAYFDQEINEKTVIINSTKYKTPSLVSGSFIKLAIKTAGPFCTVAFIVCMTIIIILVKKEEDKKQATKA